MLRSLLQAWLQNAAKEKVRQAVVQAARGQMTQAAAEPALAEGPKPCHVGVVMALGIESGSLEDRLEGCLTIRGDGFAAREGGLGGRRVVLVLSGAGRNQAARATEVLIDGHKPQRVVSAGFAGGLCPKLKRNDILIANRIVLAGGGELPLDLPADVAALGERPGVYLGALLSTDHVVRLPQQKRLLFDRHAALAVDMETFAVAEVCRRREVPFLSVRVINDTADEELSHDVEHLLAQKSGAAQWGAALGAIWRRPGSVKDLYQLRENALVAAERLAKFLAGCVFNNP